MSDYFETGFVVGQASGHRKENLLVEAPPTAEEALVAAGLDWEVKECPLFFNTPHVLSDDTPAGIITTSMRALVRSTDNLILGTCEDRYQVFQNREGFQWCAPLVETGWWKFETGGSLLNGKVCWVLLRQDETEIVPNDKLLRYLLVTWNHTGRVANVIKLTSTRVVCWNTICAALAGAGAKSTISHFESMAMKYKEIQAYYLSTTAAFARQEEWCRRLVDTKMTDGALEQYVDTVFPPAYMMPDGGLDLTDRMTAQLNNVNNRVKELVMDGKAAGTDVLGIRSTAWGAFNGVTQYIEYEQGSDQIKDRGWRILFGAGAEAQNRAAVILADLVGVPLPEGVTVN